MYREEGERGYKCIFGGGRGYLRGPLGGRIDPGAIIGWALGWYWWAEEGLSVRVALLGIISVSISLASGRVILVWVPLGFPS